MFRKIFDPLHFKICDVFGKSGCRCLRFLKPAKITKAYCSTVEAWMNDLFVLGQITNVIAFIVKG